MKKENSTENGLQDELESLYKNVARNDQADGDIAAAEDLSSCYAVLQVNPDASQAEIAQSYEKLKDTWREDRFINVDAWQAKSKEKLREIKDAYEKILSLRLYESPNGNRTATANEPAEAFFSAEPEKIPEEINTASVNRNKRSSHRMRWLTGVIVAVMLPIGGLFVWPTMYHYESIKVENNVFPLRVNRLTSNTTYFNGRKWVNPPIPVHTSQNALKPSNSALPPENKKEIQPVPDTKETAKSLSPSPKTGETVRREAEPKKVISAESALDLRKSAPAAPSAQKKPLKSATTSSVSMQKSLRFSIQIKAFREESKARTFIQELPAYKRDVHLERAIHKDKNVWYRVLLGQFKTKDQAINYLKEKKISDIYPGSFVQITGKAS